MTTIRKDGKIHLSSFKISATSLQIGHDYFDMQNVLVGVTPTPSLVQIQMSFILHQHLMIVYTDKAVHAVSYDIHLKTVIPNQLMC
jgi:hypothetical protein